MTTMSEYHIMNIMWDVTIALIEYAHLYDKRDKSYQYSGDISPGTLNVVFKHGHQSNSDLGCVWFARYFPIQV